MLLKTYSSSINLKILKIFKLLAGQIFLFEESNSFLNNNDNNNNDNNNSNNDNKML